MQEWIWNQFGLRIPSDWEMLQLSKDSSKGNCAFADRKQFRLELNWRKFDEWPDFERMLSDYKSKLTDDQEMSQFKNVTHGAWAGFSCFGDIGWTTRMGRFFDRVSKLVELVFLWEDTVNESEIKEILDSFVLHLPKNGEQRWKAFGMDFVVTESSILSQCRVQPAFAGMTFVDRLQRPTRKEVFERLGLIDEWLKCDLKTWLSVKRPDRITECTKTSSSHAHHSMVHEKGWSPALNFPQFNKKKNVYAGSAWICPVDNRLFHVLRILPAKEETRGPGEIRLSCCDAMALGDKI